VSGALGRYRQRADIGRDRAKAAIMTVRGNGADGERSRPAGTSERRRAPQHTPPIITLRAITSDNWRAALALNIAPEQMPFVSDSPAPVAIALAKAFIRPGGATVLPYGIYAGAQLVGFLALIHEAGRTDRCWINHFFIDSRQQREGYGSAALRALVGMLGEQCPQCRSVNLTVNPRNDAAQKLYQRFGFVDTGEEAYGEPWYRLALVASSDGRNADTDRGHEPGPRANAPHTER
jgi:diamine N-acetyltransferase